ncbi:MAG TPA: SRPBCC domain-containing protein [Marmoricola sp.]|nr:SRPBCC domain-containing protein [Marmoricola sp.]
MRFTDVRAVAAPTDHVWTALHDPEVLRAVIPGCRALDRVGAERYAATLGVQVGLLTDTYRGTFLIHDGRPGSELRVLMDGRGRCGHVELQLRVRLTEGSLPASTDLAYDARVTVGGLVARLGRAPLTVAAGHLTGCFFRDLDRAMRAERGDRPNAVASLAPAS